VSLLPEKPLKHEIGTHYVIYAEPGAIGIAEIRFRRVAMKVEKARAFDDCRESDGTMIEAKGLGYAEMLQDRYLGEEVIPGRWLKQARSQVAAAGARDVEWFFAEPEAARKAGELFGDYQTLQRIKIFVIPAEAP
jgi:hypothetical protein